MRELGDAGRPQEMEARQVGPYGQEKVVFARGGKTQQIAGVPETGDAQHLVLREALLPRENLGIDCRDRCSFGLDHRAEFNRALEIRRRIHASMYTSRLF